jgi:histone deacetylase HOS3
MSPSSLRSPLGGPTPEVEEKPAPTAASIANTYFQAELDTHHRENHGTASETVVILHDSCYGHRFSRPRTSKSALSTIVERPERIKASALGVSLAYVRLGERHADGAHPLHPKLNPASIPTIPFRIHKTTRKLPLMSQTVTHVHGTKWMEELKIMCDTAESKLAMNGKELHRPETSRGPDQEAPRKLHEGDLYLCAESLDALEGSLGGVCEAVDMVFQAEGPKRAFVAIRPPGHHCSASYPSGFCWINNVHVGIMHAILSHGLTHAAIIDFDLHHGDGSQAIAWDHNSRGVGLGKNAAWWKKSSIGYFSLHDINSYPCEMGDPDKVRNASVCVDNAHGQNIWNVHLEPWKSEAEFWELYETKYYALLEKTRKYLKLQFDISKASKQAPKGAIFLSAGFDASEWESAGMQRHNVNVPTEFYARLTRDVIKIANEEGTSVEGRVISVLEGGYSDRALFSGILSHLSGLAGEDPVPTKEEDYNGLGYEMGQRMGTVHDRRESLPVKSTARPYEPSWWSVEDLERMEAMLAPPPPKSPKQTRQPSAPPTYSSPTQSSTAKVVRTPTVRRSMSNMSAMSAASPLSRPPSPPPPEVPWPVSAHELCKLLIPSDRETGSCKPEDLSAEATRARRDRQTLLSQSLPAGTAAPEYVPASPAAPSAGPGGATRVSMRERKQVKPFGVISEEEEERKNRRKTVAGSAVLAVEKASLPTPRHPTVTDRPYRVAARPVRRVARDGALAWRRRCIRKQPSRMPLSASRRAARRAQLPRRASGRNPRPAEAPRPDHPSPSGRRGQSRRPRPPCPSPLVVRRRAPQRNASCRRPRSIHTPRPWPRPPTTSTNSPRG